MKLQDSSHTTTTLNHTSMCTHTVKWSPTLHVTVPNRQLQSLLQMQNVISRVLSEPPEQILSHLHSLYTLDEVHVHFSSIRSPLELIVNELNSLPIAFPDLRPDTCSSSRCHPLILKPVRTTGDGNCMYNAVSLTLTGTEHFAHLIRLLCAYALCLCVSEVQTHNDISFS